MLRFPRQKFPRIAATAAVTFLLLPMSVVLAQNTPSTGAETTTAPATTTPPAATTTTPSAATTTSTEPAKAPKKKTARKMTRQQEIDRSIDNGTVPARYRRSVPKEYQQYIPFEKR
jgi:hypothetical protein